MFDVGPGAHRVTLRFGATPSEILGGYISLGALVLLGAAVAK
jgi:hypothetical protein